MISNNDVGMKEQIKKGINGYLIENNHFEKISYYLDSLIKDSDLRKIMGDNAVKNIEENFSLPIIAARVKYAIDK